MKGNPVGGFILKKDIYIIKNTINDKVYIGQSVNAAERWLKHISEARHRKGTFLSKAMAELGIDKFYYQILESQVEDFDEKEKYWIEQYNSIYPNGYNLSPGGKGNGCGLQNPHSFFKSQEEIDNILSDIKNTNMSFEKIAQKYGCSVCTVSAINIGEAYYDAKINYPIRISRKDKDLIMRLIYSLQYELDKSINALSREYGVEKSVVHDINVGNLHRIKGKTYPLRQGRTFSKISEHVPEIIDLLKNSEMMQKEIARKFNVSTSFISSINKGRIYASTDEKYPLRKNYQRQNGGRKSFSPNEVKEIEDLLKNQIGISIRQIAQMYETSVATIQNMNKGSIIKYRDEKKKYPLRKTTPVSTIRA